VRDGAGVDLTVISPAHSDGAAALLLGDVDGQDTVAEDSVIEVQVALFLLICRDSNYCRTNPNGDVTKALNEPMIQ